MRVVFSENSRYKLITLSYLSVNNVSPSVDEIINVDKGAASPCSPLSSSELLLVPEKGVIKRRSPLRVEHHFLWISVIFSGQEHHHRD